MRYNGVILRKIELIEKRLNKLETLLPLKTETLSKDYFLKSGIERTLQVCIEAVIDIAERIISLNKQAPASSSYKALERLEELQIIKSTEKYLKMIQFRNFIVHRYESIDNEELIFICNHNLQDFKNFIDEIQSNE